MRFSPQQDHDDSLSDINVTPLIDVMLVLLVIFIVTAPMLTNAIPVNLPKTEGVEAPAPKTPLILNVSREGQISLGDDVVPMDRIQAVLSERASQQDDMQVQLQADDGVPYGTVAQVMALIERAGITRLSVMTQR